MREVELPLLHCYRCGNTWTPRSRVVKICPRCKSPNWEEAKLRVPRRGNGLGIEDIIEPHRREIVRLMRSFGVKELRVFGSVARHAATQGSDVDILVEFDRSVRTKSTLRSIDLAIALEKVLGRPVDVVTEASLHWFVQPQVVAEAVPI